MIAKIEAIPNGVAGELEPGQEIPKSENSNGFGHASIVVDQAAHRARYHVEWRGLTGPPTAAHFHIGAAGTNGPPAHSIALVPGDSIYEGVWNGMSDADIRAVAEARVYVNVHTAQYPDGEIRGQILPTEIYTAAIEPANVVPPVTGSDATGTAYLVVTTFPGNGTFVRASAVVGGTLDTIDAVDIHGARIGVNGPAILQVPKDAWSYWELQRSYPASPDLPAEIRLAIRLGAAYIDAHTAFQADGEARGQFIASAANFTTSSAPAAAPDAAEAALAATIDPATGTIRFAVGRDVLHGDRRVVLYSALGDRVAAVDLAVAAPAIDATSLPSGMYIAQLLVDGRAVGMCRVGVVR